ncbi:MAG TPA: exodeoxyribonuclease V subunit alpha, partial [Xanthomonadales bacterium]|nr:exodeoxyribonuclease V subunit alpha [Xanthomonadales bacterium]
LRRYREYERDLARLVRERAALADAAPDAQWLADALRALFPAVDAKAIAACVAIARGEPARDAPDPQALASALALRQRLTVLCGGPGTGKTYTVVRLLALLAMRAPDARIALAAPTGKAATRMTASLQAGLPSLAQAIGRDEGRSHIAEALQLEATTVHRLLKLGANQVTPRFDERRPLPLDVLVVDECSMLDLPLFTKLLRAVPKEAHLVLVGDPEQLPAVEGGAVLTALAETGNGRPQSVLLQESGAPMQGAFDFDARAAPASPVGERVVRLVQAHRFGEGGRIAALVAATREGDARAVRAALGAGGEVAWYDAPVSGARAAFEALVRDGYGALRTASRDRALAALDRFRVLSALRDGASGVAGLNDAIQLALDVRAPEQALHAGQPVLVVANDYDLDLYNGDTGVVLPGDDGALRIFFRTAGGAARDVAPAQLPAHETGYAMTVHKAQGSEFDEVVLVLPRESHPLLTREWLYTAVSRAKTKLTVFAPFAVIEAALARRQSLMSGLADRLR